MEFAFGMKDIIYIVVFAITYIVSIVTVVVTVRSKIKGLEEVIHLIKSVLFQDDATLNLVNVEACKLHRDNVYTQIRREATAAEKSFESIEKANDKVEAKMDKVNSNILKIAFHMGVELKD